MVTSMGRTGSTMLVRLLGEHPDVVSVPPFEYEPKVATYWAEILLELTDPAGYRRQIAPGRNLEDRWWLGESIPLPRPLKSEAISGWLDSDALDELASFCLGRVDALYGRIAEHDGKAGASLFAEKYWGATATPALVRELYPDHREVFIVRDFRDMLASMHAFDEKSGFVRFGRQFADSDAQHVHELGRRAARLLAAFEAQPAAALVRYEDLVRDPDSTLAGLLQRLELDGDPATIAAMRDGLERSDVAHHVTTDDPEESIGRWRRDLPPELQEASLEAFGPALEGFGYG
jgi:Sulfotransferase family